MRTTLLSLVLASACVIATPMPQAAAAATTTPAISAPMPIVYAMQVPDKTIEVTVNQHGGGRWYRSPVWIAIGALAGVVVLLLVILAVRGGGGTTIVKE